MSGSAQYTPTLAGFIAWVRTAMQISVDILPDDSIWFVYAYNVAFDINDPSYACVSPIIYMLMVYNLGGDNLVNFAQDNPALPPPENTYFTDLRKSLKINNFVAGVVQNASDQGTAMSALVPDFFKTLTLANLQQLKTPWGLTYLSYAQRTGTQWGIS